ncbi:MAG TPA: hypothetical protein QGF58_24000 [Myxococcota bacterium]|nr:hypothetical protein [Myxococcota bacterium]
MLLLLAIGCYTHDKYTADLNSAKCESYSRCDLLGTLGFDSVDDCIAENDAWAEADGECLDYDRRSAKRCVSGWQDIGCETMARDHPQACFEVCAEEPVDTGAEQ